MLAHGVPSRKILLGIPVYGRAFPGTDNINQRYNASCRDWIDENVFDYRDLPRPCAEEQHDASVGAGFCVDSTAGFVTYDTTTTVRQKAKFASYMKLGGLFYWHIAADAWGLRSLVATGYNALHDF
jgi:chitinase